MVPSLEKISGIGKKTAQILRQAGINSVEELASMALNDLIKVKGIGKSTAERYINNAKKFLEMKEKKEKEADEADKEEIMEELITGAEEEFSTLKKESPDLNFWNKPPYSSLLDSELAKESKLVFYNLSNLVNEFFDKMLKEEIINYKISGIALKNSAILHHYKITSVIKEEEEIQKQEDIKKLRERYRRSIPKTLPQPLRPKMEISTKEELFEAMRSAIIETMQKKEKLKRRRILREQRKQQRMQMMSKTKLPKELLKHITGKEQTVEELHESWLNRIKSIINLNNKENTSFFELIDLINKEEKTETGKRFSLVRLFLALMFLSTGGIKSTGKMNPIIQLFQEQDFEDIKIQLK
ncbi:MAG: helix-hairpin-helix domain-containing protein [Promethearchaeota archaeon]